MAWLTARAVLRSTLRISVKPDFLSTMLTMACLWFLPITVSASQSPIRLRVSTMAGRSSMDRLGTGCRLNEVLTMKKYDIDMENRVMKIAAINAKGKRVRSVPLNGASLEIIRQQFADTEGYEHLFINHQTGKPYTTITRAWMRIRSKAGLPHLRLHDLRHSYASFLVNSGRTLYEVQQILAHSQSIVTERYSHLSTKTLQDASNSASVIIQGAMQTGLVKANVSLPSPVPSQSIEDVAVIEVVSEDRMAA